MFLSKSRSTSSQSQVQATSRTVLQPFGSRERSDARMHNMYSARFTVPLATLAICRHSTSHSSCILAEIETSVTTLWK